MALKKILVADDSLTIQKVIRLALSNEGYQIETVSDGNELMQRLAVSRPDVVLVEASLPGKSAYDARRELLQSADGSKARFVLMSSAYEQINEELYSELQFHGRLIKPFDPGLLRKVIHDAMSPESLAPKGSKDSKKTKKAKHDPAPETGFTGLIETDEATLSKNPWDDSAHTMTGLVFENPASGGEDDIVKLTENTVKMSGLDNYQWNVSEPGKLPHESDPELAPPTRISEMGGVTLNVHEQALQAQAKAKAPPAFGQKPSGIQSHAPAADRDQVASIVRNELEDSIRQLARQLLPEIAERVIKEEIHKMLSNPPS